MSSDDGKIRMILLLKQLPLSIRLISVLIFLSACGPKQTMTSKLHKNYHTDCEACHTSAKPEEISGSFIDGLDPSSLCYKCHYYSSNHHPVDFVPDWPYTLRAIESYPRFNGEIRCLTCHEIHAGPGLNEIPKLLRNGPFDDRRESCFSCHYQGKFVVENPHLMLTESGDFRQIDGEPVCLVCHRLIPDPEVDRTDDVTFNADIAFLCWRCHPPMEGEFFDQHFHVRPSEQALEKIARTVSEGNVILPLSPRGLITCSTCHNPHQAEVLSYEPARATVGQTKKLRQPNLCIACHEV